MYRHLDEGLDDMPAHVKSSLMGPSLTIPVGKGRLCLGTWQVGRAARAAQSTRRGPHRAGPRDRRLRSPLRPRRLAAGHLPKRAS
jgi:hypothetical protein